MHTTAELQRIDRAKPRLRGVLHQIFFFVALAAALPLVQLAPAGAAPRAAAIYAASLCALLGVSALYHRRTWRSRSRVWMRRLDHAAIFVLIAGTYTPCCLALQGDRRLALWLVWAAAAAGALKAMLWPFSPKWVSAALCLLMGWGGVLIAPAVFRAAGAPGFALMAAGGLLYTVGALIYAAKRPNPIPGWFGYHEVFHALVVAAAVCHFALVARIVTRMSYRLIPRTSSPRSALKRSAVS